MYLTSTLGAKQIAEARQWSDLVEANVVGDDYTGVNWPDRYFIGYLGELAVVDVLERFGVLVRLTVRVNGKSQDGEIHVWSRNVRKSLDAKTASEAWHKCMMITESQKLDANIYVGARIESIDANYCVVSVHGWLSQSEVAALPIRTDGLIAPARVKQLTGLHDMKELVGFLDKARDVVTTTINAGA